MPLFQLHSGNALSNLRRARRIAWIASMLLAPLAAARAQTLDWSRSPSSGIWFAESPAPMSWKGADALARHFGGHLATVRDSADNTWLDATFLSALTVHRHHWIGLYQDVADPNYAEPAGGWKWSSGAPLAFVQWDPSQPDDAGGAQHFGRTAGKGAAFPALWFDDSDSAESVFGDSGDLYLAPGDLMIFNTSSSNVTVSQIQFVPGTDDVQFALPLSSKQVLEGVLEVDDFYISSGATMKVEGPRPLVIMARGRVVIRGKLECSGTSSPGVSSINTTNIPVLGSSGQAGGGRGGTGSPLTSASSPSGLAGFGAFHVPDGGGGGGETGWSPDITELFRRGAGGGGGALAANVPAPPTFAGPFWQARIGFDAEPGFSNVQAHNGAINGPGPAFGGPVGPRPFLDGDASNDFYGRAVDSAGNVIVGELIRPWAGAGGGGGGDASRVLSGSFPGPWNPSGDERGAGGGGGGGSCHIMALGRIVFGASGQILARGGTGGGGENTIFLNRVGGGSGGGSGGHVVLQSAVHIDLRAKAGVNPSAILDNTWAVDVRGAQGGAGTNDLGGAIFTVNGLTETSPTFDACPPGYPLNVCRGHNDGTGGDGGPGIVQFHTPLGVIGSDPLTADILVAASVPITALTAPAPLFGTSATGERLALDIGSGLALFELDSDDCDGNGVPDRYEVISDASLDLDRDGVLDACDTTVTYCVGAPSGGGCALNMRSTGVPSATAASGFELVVEIVDGQRSGSFVFGLAPSSTPFSNNTMCVALPRQRLGLLNSGGTAGSCDGELRLDWNAWRATHPTGLGSPYNAGQVLYAQGWLRDPTLAASIALSSAHRFTLQP